MKNTKRNNLKFSLAIILLAAVLLIGQRGCQRDGNTKTGTEGLEVTFLQASPPDQISQGQSFPIYSQVENKGSYDVKSGEAQFYLEGILPESFALSRDQLKKENKLSLRAAEEDITGGKERIVFADRASYGGVVPFNAKFFVKSCYLYESEIRTDLCFALEDNDICKLKDKIEKAEASDSPVQVTSFSEERSGKNLLIKFKAENKGRGKVYAPDADCDSLEPFKENRVLIQLETSEPVNCIGQLDKASSGEADLNSVIACKRNMENTQAHVSPVSIKLRYKYVEFAEKSVLVTE